MRPNKDSLVLFWGGALSPVLQKLPEDDRSDRQILLTLCDQQLFHPNGDFRTFSLSTFQRKLKAFRESGIEGFLHNLRSDDGKIRGDRDKVMDRATELKRENPFRSDLQINLILRDEGMAPIPSSTLHRQLNRRGVTARKLGYEGTIIRKRWSREHTNSLWVGDFSQGPNVIDENGEVHKTWNSAFIDAHSRFLVVGIYAYTSDLDALIRSLLAAFELHGKPKTIYLDNAKVYRSNVLARACLELGIDLIHRKVRDPQGGGIIERFFLTAQKQLESEIIFAHEKTLTLEKLNEFFSAWVSQVYHKTKHSEVKQAPEKRYSDGLLCPVSPMRAEDIRHYFFHQKIRSVHNDFCDVSIDTIFFKVDSKLRGDKVLVRYLLGELGDIVEIYSLNGRRALGIGQRHDRSHADSIPKPPPPTEEKVDFGAVLLRLQQKDDEKKALVIPHRYRAWDLATFASKMCEVAGVDISELTELDLEVLGRVHKNNTDLGIKKLKLLWTVCQPQTFNQLLIQLSLGKTL
jgi:putative transposase